jgi:hypothetical protein
MSRNTSIVCIEYRTLSPVVLSTSYCCLSLPPLKTITGYQTSCVQTCRYDCKVWSHQQVTIIQQYKPIHSLWSLISTLCSVPPVEQLLKLMLSAFCYIQCSAHEAADTDWGNFWGHAIYTSKRYLTFSGGHRVHT